MPSFFHLEPENAEELVAGALAREPCAASDSAIRQNPDVRCNGGAARPPSTPRAQQLVVFVEVVRVSVLVLYLGLPNASARQTKQVQSCACVYACVLSMWL